MSDEEKKELTEEQEPLQQTEPEQAEAPEASAELPPEPETASEEPETVPDNIIQLPEDPHLQELRRRRRKRILILVGLALIAVVVLLFVLLPDVFDFDAIRRYFHYMGKQDRNGYGIISFDSSSTNDFIVLGDGMVLGTEGGLYYYDLSGEQESMVQATVASPRLLANRDTAVCYSMGSSYLALINERGERLLDTTLGGMLLDVDLSRDGYISYNLTEDGYKTVTTVLNRSHEPIYRYRSSTQYLNACAVSEGGAYVAVSGLTEENSSFSSTLSILRTDEEIIAGTDQSQTAKHRVSLGNQLVYEMRFLSKNRLCVLTQDSVMLYDTECNLIGEQRFDTSYLRGYAISEQGFVALLLGQSMTGDRYELRTVDKNGETLGSLELTSLVRSMDAGGHYVSVLTDEALLVYREKLQSYRSSVEIGNATHVLTREDGTALLISNGMAELYIP